MTAARCTCGLNDLWTECRPPVRRTRGANRCVYEVNSPNLLAPLRFEPLPGVDTTITHLKKSVENIIAVVEE